jgi:hypothetical protein
MKKKMHSNPLTLAVHLAAQRQLPEDMALAVQAAVLARHAAD